MKIESKSNYKIPIKEFKPNKVEKVIIACHGFGGDKESSAIELLAQKLIEKNIMVIAFDFPAHGESKENGKKFRVENKKTILYEYFVRANSMILSENEISNEEYKEDIEWFKEIGFIRIEEIINI